MQSVAVTGYQRIQQFSHFFPKINVKDALIKKVGKNNVVTIIDFILGNDYTKIESPYLAKGLLEEVRKRNKLDKEMHTRKYKEQRRLAKFRMMSFAHCGPPETLFEEIEEEIFELRMASTHPLEVLGKSSDPSLANNRFVKHYGALGILKKCAKLYEKYEIYTRYGSSGRWIIQKERGKFQDGLDTVITFDDMMARNMKLFYAISEAIPVCLGLLHPKDREGLKKKYTNELLCIYLKVSKVDRVILPEDNFVRMDGSSILVGQTQVLRQICPVYETIRGSQYCLNTRGNKVYCSPGTSSVQKRRSKVHYYADEFPKFFQNNPAQKLIGRIQLWTGSWRPIYSSDEQLESAWKEFYVCKNGNKVPMKPDVIPLVEKRVHYFPKKSWGEPLPSDGDPQTKYENPRKRRMEFMSGYKYVE